MDSDKQNKKYPLIYEGFTSPHQNNKFPQQKNKPHNPNPNKVFNHPRSCGRVEGIRRQPRNFRLHGMGRAYEKVKL